MTAADLSGLLSADLSDLSTRLILADALEDAGRESLSRLVRRVQPMYETGKTPWVWCSIGDGEIPADLPEDIFRPMSCASETQDGLWKFYVTASLAWHAFAVSLREMFGASR